jgi:SOS-response transcriptional repressor LexA
VNPTPRQAEVLEALEVFINERGHPPTARELAHRLGTSLGSVHRMLQVLRNNGLVSWEDGRARTLRVTAER